MYLLSGLITGLSEVLVILLVLKVVVSKESKIEIPCDQPYIQTYRSIDTNYEIEIYNDYSKLYIKITNTSEIEKGYYIFEDSIENIY